MNKTLLLITLITLSVSCSKEEPEPESCYTCFGFQSAAGMREAYCGTKSGAESYEVALNQIGGQWECREN